MPPWVAALPRSTLLRTGQAIGKIQPALKCSHSTLIARSPTVLPRSPASFPRSSTQFSRLPARRIRYASTIVSPTTINLRPNILPANKELYNALKTLRWAAKDYVNASRVDLALQGLTAQDAVTRVAVFGLNSQVSAQRLTRLLLADPLGAEELWEKELEKPIGAQEQPLLLKYGDESDNEPPTSLYKVVPVPSRMLKSHNMEILVSSLKVPSKTTTSASTESSEDSLLVPKLQDSSTADSSASYPVHKTLVLGVGVDGAIAYGRFSSDNARGLDNMVKVAVDLTVPLKEKDQRADDGSAAIDMEVGAEALAIFRKSIENSLEYERGWYQSGLPALSTWLIEDLEPSEPMKPVVKTLISSIASDVESNIAKAVAAHLRKVNSIPTEDNVTKSILAQLDSWAEKSHSELRDQLDEAFSTKAWLGLSWWKLFWRVDDIPMITSEILERKWLVTAERSSFYLAGSMNRAGFPDDVRKLKFANVPDTTTTTTTRADKINPETTTTKQDTASSSSSSSSSLIETATEPTTTTSTQLNLSTTLRTPLPWPDHIPTSRTSLITETIPPLQSLAQRLILQTITTTSISSAISVLLYFSLSSFSAFEASTVAALGLTFSLRKMQKFWENARRSWQGTIREEGRRTLKEEEEMVRLIVGAYRRERVRDVREKEREGAREAVGRVRAGLGRVR